MLTRSILLAALATISTATYDVVVYWGQNNGERDLAAYCQASQSINILVLSFLDNFGGGVYPSGNFGSCQVFPNQTFSSSCTQLASNIKTCQKAGIKVFLSSGGYNAPWCLNSTSDAANVASSLWNSYGAPTVTNKVVRPFGNVAIDGWDFDIENYGTCGDNSITYLGSLITSLRSHFASDTSKSYYISGSPQCDAPEKFMNNAIQSSQFDHLFIQFYNNYCAAADMFKNPNDNPDGNGGSFNLAAWPGTIRGGKSAKASLFAGLPASPAAANVWDFITVGNLTKSYQNASSVPGFGGISLWEAVYSSDKQRTAGHT